MDKVVRVDMGSLRAEIQPAPASWERVGGRALIARILTDEVDPQCYPLGPKNKLVLATGILSGLTLSSSNRLSIGAKSPLTGGIKESNAGGTTAFRLVRLGYKAVVVEGRPADDKLYLLHIGKDKVELLPADDLRGVRTYELSKRLREKYGPKVGIACIGPAGELQLNSACVNNIDPEGRPSRVNGRGGMGAVMGSKGLKAIVVDEAGGAAPAVADKEAYQAAAKRLTTALQTNPTTSKAYTLYGTPGILSVVNNFGALPTKNFSQGQFEGVAKVCGDYVHDLIEERGGEGEISHACMPGCIVRSSNVYVDKNGKEIVGPIEYETIALVGTNCGIGDLDEIAKLNYIMNDIGVDTVEVGAAAAVAMEAGVLAFGDVAGFQQLLEDVAKGTVLGRMIGSGATTTGKVLGVEHVAAVKGQAMPAYDPRGIKGVGVTYATSPQGADHTAGHTIRAQVDHLDPAPQAKLSAGAQINMAGYDSLGVCMFASAGVGPQIGMIAELVNGRHGWNVEENFLQTLGKECLRLEKRYNRAAGFTSADDRIPEWMCREPLAPMNSVFDVPAEDLDAAVEG